MKLFSQLILESQASDQAHKMGLKSVGWGKWKDSSGKVTHQTKDGKLVKVGSKEKRNSKEKSPKNKNALKYINERLSNESPKIKKSVYKVYSLYTKLLNGSKTWEGYCRDVSDNLIKELKKNGVNAKLIKYEGKQLGKIYHHMKKYKYTHWAVALSNKKILDLTADQFGLDRIMITNLDKKENK